MKRVITLSLVALGLVALVTGIALAHEEQFVTKKVKIQHPTPQTFSGKVKARGGCKVDRTVKVTRVDEYVGGDPVGAVKTDSTGAWTMELPAAVSPGSYKAVAKKTSVEHRDELHKCKKGTSRILAVG